ncbi:replicative helicase loader/inhibitor [Neobacillus dielmonensis]|uniref:replicative helicase loader/inhibitor n=1 Tax=Neobacillus dielmonensis TaxID=1347369 RepID=UPI000693604A|nr:replicative helicase loader/inhibitor [Neobacillus dielmonensis]
MTKSELMKLLVLTEKAYPKFLFKDGTVQQWFEFCSQMDFDKVMAKLKNHIRISPFPPAMADIAVFASGDAEIPKALQRWMNEERERIEREQHHFHRTELPYWIAEYSVRSVR